MSGNKSKIIRFGPTGEAVDRLVEEYENNNVEGVVIAVKGKDGILRTFWSDKLNFLERLGMVECLKSDMVMNASCPLMQEGEE